MTDAAIIFRTHMEAIENLPEEQQLAALKAIVYYCMDNEEPKDGTAACVLLMAKPVLDKWKSRREAGKSGGEANRKQTGSKTEPKEKEKEKDVKEKDSLTRVQRERFTPPTVEEVRSYCLERQNTVDAEQFVDFYASKGWKVGSQPMKDWKACVRTWEKKREKKTERGPNRFDRNMAHRTGTDRQANDALVAQLLAVGG